ncbi:hypothetical protein BKI52_08245 [marine bacterium AO1-C]|nr:hypothetical protein BKI52_08245 [marine bacterium AO1-C]
MKKISLLFVLMLSVVSLAISQNTKTSTKKKRVKFIPIPIISYSPETRLALGALGQLTFKLNGEDTLSRSSSAQATFIYTLNNQYLIEGEYTLLFNKEKYILNGEASFRKFPEFYYGIGNNTNETNEEEFSYLSFDWDGYFVRKLRPNLFVGISYKFSQMYGVELTENTTLGNSTLPGAKGFRVTGVGPTLIYDSRNSVINATRGAYVETFARFFNQSFGGDYDYQFYRIDARKYFPLSSDERHVLALQALGEFREGTIPVHQLSRMGGDAIMRGHYNGRFREKHYWAMQSEYRFPIYRFLGAVGFAGIGNVCKDCFSSDAFKDLKYSVGGGLRIMVDKEERVNLRIDYAFVEGGSEFYIQFTEAF